ncbi:unnamed protein product [Allacma fusca]|uniref:Attractin-like protein 1 n=1 Tax=Allacma fusca TaxID=39272 RepID=A0A8J2NYY3_9HEXA|nr:unnamed protein product [Allacma fusca]
MAFLQKFLFLFKSKYRRKWNLSLTVFVVWCFYFQFVKCVSVDCGAEDFCQNGECVNNTCVCNPGWTGPRCQYCSGKIQIRDDRGWISDGLGNYTSNMKCTWLIESAVGSKNSKVNGTSNLSHIYLHIEEFATECGWDHLYIYDGDSVHAPLLGVFSGLLVQKNYKVLQIPEVIAKSGYALLHFYTDVAYNLTGFNVTYRTQSCPSEDSSRECSGNGVCVDGICTCNAKYSGDACNVEKCPNDCSNHGRCDMESHKCICNDGFKGHDCSQEAKYGYWEVVPPKTYVPKGSASHASVVHNNSLWVFGGNTLNLDADEFLVQRFSFEGNKWEKIATKNSENLPVVYDHSCVLFESKVYLYGGVHDGRFGNRHISNEVWSLDLNTLVWSKVRSSDQDAQCKSRMCGPIHLAGHTAVVINDKGNKSRHSKMVVIFGHSPRYGYVNVVQEFHFGSGLWNILTTKGYPVTGSYGHSSSWDPLTQKIYVFGGYRIGPDSAALSRDLFSYDPLSRTWNKLNSAPGGRFLHAGIVTKGLILIIGGNGHNDTVYSLGSKCFTSQVLVYDISCDSWSTFDPPVDLPTDLSRYGHTATVYKHSIYIYGGFNGLIANDLVRYTPGSCDELKLSTNHSCLDTLRFGVKCQWNRTSKKCESVTNTPAREKDKDGWIQRCLIENKRNSQSCETFQSCSTCLQNKSGCVWCGDQCQQSSKCKDSHHKTAVSQCEESCGAVLHNCNLCSLEPNCIWIKNDQCVPYRNNTELMMPDKDTIQCDNSCAEHSSCTNCTLDHCMWCNNLNVCVDKNSYVISFPYGQCMSWSQMPSLCLSRNSRSVSPSLCDEIASCDTCRSLPSCGWCDNGEGTGVGRCIEGSSRGPVTVNSTGASLNKSLCPLKNWFFTACPACQCNGHSLCDENSRCSSCDGFTEGEHCETCIRGYHGNPVNGGGCKQCECNNQAETCHHETGRCFCTTKGITGEHCERCDIQNSYAGDPINGSCFYELQIDYQFTFNLSKKEDRHYNQINFRNSPSKIDIDAEFHIHCSIPAKMNITVKIGPQEKPLLTNHNCSTFKSRFGKQEYNFGTLENTTFYVYVYDFQPPLLIQISFSQSPKLDLLHFFITFSTCFLMLLLVAAILWKIKQKYDMYRRRQRLFVEMEQMASRPFAQVYVELGKSLVPSGISTLRKRKKDCPSPIALEPCQGNRAAVLSLLVSLPTGSHSFAPPGQPGLSVGSTLVSLGNPRKGVFLRSSREDSPCLVVNFWSHPSWALII